MCWQMVSDVLLIQILKYQVMYSTHSTNNINLYTFQQANLSRKL